MACYGEDGKGFRYLDLLPLYIPLNRSSREYVSSGIPRKVAFQEILRFLGNAGIQVREFIGSTGEGWAAGDRTG